jgi:signal peptidase I
MGGEKMPLALDEHVFHLVMLGFLTTLAPRQLLLQFLNTTMVVASALAGYKFFSLIVNTESPIAVVLTESMTPAFVRGDLIFLALTPSPLKVGDIAVFNLGLPYPVVHRILEVHDTNEGRKILTKGDYNPVDDRGLYSSNQIWVAEKDVIARVYAHAPYLGMITIILNDYPQTKIALVLFLAITALLNKEEQTS